MDIQLDKANAEVDAFIDKRDKQREAVNAREEGWRQSVREHHARRREQNRWEWIRYFETLSENHQKTSERYRERADALLKEGASR